MLIHHALEFLLADRTVRGQTHQFRLGPRTQAIPEEEVPEEAVRSAIGLADSPQVEQVVAIIAADSIGHLLTATDLRHSFGIDRAIGEPGLLRRALRPLGLDLYRLARPDLVLHQRPRPIGVLGRCVSLEEAIS